MNIIRVVATVFASLSFGMAVPVLAQSKYPMVPGEYVDMAMVTVDDGHSLDYARYLAAEWKRNQEYAKAQGWINSYEVLANVNKRPGEPDIYLVTRFNSLPDAAEEQRRNDAYLRFAAKSDTQLEQETGTRATYRHVIGDMLLRKIDWKK